jgi:hypothetical protein
MQLVSHKGGLVPSYSTGTVLLGLRAKKSVVPIPLNLSPTSQCSNGEFNSQTNHKRAWTFDDVARPHIVSILVSLDHVSLAQTNLTGADYILLVSNLKPANAKNTPKVVWM